jgi:Bacterial Ig domain
MHAQIRISRNRIHAAVVFSLVGAFALTGVAAAGTGKGGGKSDRTAPSISIKTPAAGSTLTGSATISGTAGDNTAVAKVEVAIDGGSYQSASGTTAWQAPLNTAGYANGTHLIAARASDRAGNTTVASLTVSISNVSPAPPPPPPDTTPPAVAITLPSNGATVNGTTSVTGSASDNAALARVEVSVDGGAYQLAQGTSNWSYSLDTTAYGDGSHNISARATDSVGNVGSTAETINVQNAPSPGTAQHMVTPEGATIDVSSDVPGWTAQQIYDLLKPNAYQLSLLGPTLAIKVQTQYVSMTTTGVSEVGGVYENYHATIYLDARAGMIFNDRPDYTIAHEYGHAWSTYHLYMTENGDWSRWLNLRGIASDPRLDSSLTWDRSEMIADDYRMLFATANAVSEAAYINPDVPDPRTVTGLRDFLASTW